MDINQDLNDLLTNKRTTLEIIKDLEEQAKEINRRKHLVKIVDVANELQKLTDNDVFNENKIGALVISYVYDHDLDDQNNGYVFRYTLLRKDGEEIRGSHGNKRLIDWFYESFDFISGFDTDNINSSFQEREKITLKADKDLSSKFLDLMLSNELKLVFQYNDLQTSLSLKDNEKKELKAKL